MKLATDTSTQALVFLLVASAFTVVYITQPVLPVLEKEFNVDARSASLSVSMVIFGIAIANLPFGSLADRYPIRPIIAAGGSVIAITSLVCALTHHFAVLIGARFLQGLFIPVTDDVHRSVSRSKLANRAPQRRHGLLRRSDCGRGSGW